jgi:hypothetical protein
MSTTRGGQAGVTKERTIDGSMPDERGEREGVRQYYEVSQYQKTMLASEVTVSPN